ncbi:MAG TPA: ATP-binding protein [Aestuariivirga sp.]|nr:ATP-binding protein [Aestuariivirga sp.]
MNAVQKQHVNNPNTWRKAFIGTIDDISAAAQWVATIAADQQFPEQLVFALQVCLEELLTNVVRHGGATSSGDLSEVPIPPLNVEISISTNAQRVSMTVEDNGKPFDVVNAPVHRIDQPLDEVQPGGLGIQLIRNFASTIAYERAGLGNRVVVEFLL